MIKTCKTVDTTDMPEDAVKYFRWCWDMLGNDTFMRLDMYQMWEEDNPLVNYLKAVGALKEDEIIVLNWW